MWTDSLRQEIAELFIEARYAGRQPRLSLWCLQRHSSKLERRRRWYSIRKQIQPRWYAAMLERANRNAKRWRQEHPDIYRRHQEQKARRNAERRAQRTRNLVCAKCHCEFQDRFGIGQIPKYCSARCNRRAAGLAYFYRQKEKLKQKSGASGKFFVGPHAVKRYRERVHRGISYERAMQEILQEAERAHFVKKQLLAYRGFAEYWRGAKPMRLRFVVKKNPGMKLPTIITILPGHDGARAR